MRERQWGSLQKCTCVCVHIKITKRNGVYFLTLLCQTLFIQKKKKTLTDLYSFWTHRPRFYLLNYVVILKAR